MLVMSQALYEPRDVTGALHACHVTGTLRAHDVTGALHACHVTGAL